MNYKVHLCGTVNDDVQDGFKMGFDVTVENGGNVSQVANAMQVAIDSVAPKPVADGVAAHE